MASFSSYTSHRPIDLGWLEEIPVHWDVKKLKYIGDAIIGLTYSPDDVVDESEGVLVLRSSNVQNRKLAFEDNVYVNKNIPSKLVTRSGDILICARNGSRALIGKNATIDKDTEGVTFGAFMSIFRSGYHEYLSHVFNSALFEYQSGSYLTATINQLTTGNLNGFKVPLPSMPEQQKIANFLDHETAKIDTLIEKQQQLIKLLKEKRQAVISHAVTKGLNPDAPMRDSGVEWLGEVPVGWDVARIKNLALIISKGTTPSTVGGDTSESGIRFLKAENIGKSIDVKEFPEFYISESVDQLISRSRLKVNDVLVIIAGATTGLASIVQPSVLPANTNQAVSFIRPKKQLNSRLIVHWLSTVFAQRTIWMDAVQAAQPNLSMEDLGNIPIIVPPDSMLEELLDFIQSKISVFDSVILSSEKQIRLSNERRTALISAAVTGKIDVRNWQPPTPAKAQSNKEATP